MMGRKEAPSLQLSEGASFLIGFVKQHCKCKLIS